MYTVHIESTDNSWFGTGFMGIGIESMNDLKEAMFKYASNKGYWRPEIKLSFNLATTTAAFKAEGNKQCQENGFVNLIAAAAAFKRDPFYNTYIVFRPSGWVDNNGSVFRWCVVKDRQVIPVIGKCRQALEILGITLT